MQPKSKKPKDFVTLKNTMKNFTMVSHGLKNNLCYCTELPQIVGFKLTNRCNLRCKTCYEWNESGYHHFMPEDEQTRELDLELFKKVIDETENSSLYFWGGEPLYHSRFDEIAKYLENKNRITAICTNGQLLEKKMDSILRLGDKLELLIAVDGLEAENDAIRGKGTFKNVISHIKMLLDLRKRGEFCGKISIHCVISEEMVAKLYDFLLFFEELGVDTVILCYPWYLSEETSNRMDAYYQKNMGCNVNSKASWHAFKYSLSAEHYSKLIIEKNKIMDRTWNMDVRFQPDLNDEDIFLFLEDKLPLGNYRCYSIADRFDVLPDGSVSSCKHFPEMIVGNLNEGSVYDIWHGEKFNEIRKTIQSQLMPVCSVCNNLYLHGRKTI